MKRRFHLPPYWHLVKKQRAIQDQIKKMIDGLVVQTLRLYCSPIVVAKKKDSRWYLRINYCRFNAIDITIVASQLMFVYQEVIKDIDNASIFPILVLKKDHWKNQALKIYSLSYIWWRLVYQTIPGMLWDSESSGSGASGTSETIFGYIEGVILW